MKSRSLLLVLAAVISAQFAGAQAPLTVSGITDRSYGSYTGSASFRVPSTNGYSYTVLLDGKPQPTDLSVAVSEKGYHELAVWRTNLQSSLVTNTLVRFIIRDATRSNSEDGLAPWTPYPTIDSAADEFADAVLRLIVPQAFPAGYEIPVVAWVMNDDQHAIRVNGQVIAEGQRSFSLKRGVGSGLLASTNPAGPLTYAAQIKGLAANKTIDIEGSPAWSTVNGTMVANTTWQAGAHVYVNGTLTIPAGVTLTVEAGAIIRIAPGVDIYLDGALLLNGTVDRPIVFMPNSRSQPWGGFWLRTPASSIQGTGTIFTGSGANANWFTGSGGRPGSHRDEQALFYCTNNTTINLTDSAAIYLAGQLGHTWNGRPAHFLTFNRFLFQYGTTGGEYTDSVWNVNDSAFIDTYLNSPPFWQFYDGDEDALYLVNVPSGYVTGFTNTLFGWTRDDGIDSGGSGSGFFKYKNCWFESTYHEGNSLSGTESSSAHADKEVVHSDGVFINCGQGLENGYGAVTGVVSRVLMTDNNVGFRFGDNYNWRYYGLHIATNSILINNFRDVWGMTWQPDTSGAYAGWVYRTNQMLVRSNWLTAPHPVHASNEVWNPAVDAGRLLPYITTPPAARVGVGLATWTDQFALSSLFEGVPVRLSTFTTNFVTVNYSFRDGGGATLATGAVTFEPGQSVRRIYPNGFDVSGQSVVQVVLESAERGELTGRTTATYSGAVAMPVLSCWVNTNTLPMGRLAEGMLVSLNPPSGLPVQVNYSYVAGEVTLSSGTLNFAPGETVQQINPPGIDPALYDSIQLNLSNPVGAGLSGITSITYGNPPLLVYFAAGANQLDLASFAAGLQVVLNRTAATDVTVDFQCEGRGGVLTNGTVTLNAGQTLFVLTLPTVDASEHELLRVALSHAQNAQLGTPAEVYYLPIVPTPSPTLVAQGSIWNFLDTGTNAGTAWRALDYDDSTWKSGCAELGYEDGDECTVVSYGPSTTSRYITTYFRQKFVVPNPGVFTNLAMWLLRDDGGVVYLNGTEVYRSPSMPAAPTVITYQTLANAQGTSAPPDDTEDRTNLSPALLLTGTNVAAVEIHQHRADSSDISFNFSLTGQPTPLPTPDTMYWGSFGGQQALVWGNPGFGLQISDKISGPWTNVVGAISPYRPTPGAGNTFYRLRR